jgi:hypothetical protein
MTKDVDYVAGWKVGECDQWEKLWMTQCPNFVSVMHIMELRRLIAEYLIRLRYNNWQPTNKLCPTEPSNLKWHSTALNHITVVHRAASVGSKEIICSVIMGEYSCGVTAPHLAINIEPASTATYRIGFYNKHTGYQYIIGKQFIVNRRGQEWSVDYIYFAAGAQPYRHHLVPPHCIEIHLLDKTPLQLIVHTHFNDSITQSCKMELDELDWNNLHLFVDCSTSNTSTMKDVSTSFHLDYYKPKLNPTTPRIYDKTVQKMTPLPKKPKLSFIGYNQPIG